MKIEENQTQRKLLMGIIIYDLNSNFEK